MIAKTEGGARPPTEYSIGSRVLILQRRCIPDRLGSHGKVDEMQGTVPIKAKCDDCGQSIGVDLRSMQEVGRPRKPKK